MPTSPSRVTLFFYKRGFEPGVMAASRYSVEEMPLPKSRRRIQCCITAEEMQQRNFKRPSKMAIYSNHYILCDNYILRSICFEVY
jgi:hypothetical protein